MKRYIRIPEEYRNVSDDELREYILTKMKHLNGTYCEVICRNCGAYFTSPEGDTKKAVIVTKCKSCITN